jgi:cytochrome c556
LEQAKEGIMRVGLGWKFSLLGLLAAVAVGLGILANTAQSKPKFDKQAHRQFMRNKLDASQKILEGLCIEDFNLIEQGADALLKIGNAEEWRISNDPIYRQKSSEFLRVADRLKKRATEKKLDGVALTWVETTMSCIECHRWVRAELIATTDQSADAADLGFDHQLPGMARDRLDPGHFSLGNSLPDSRGPEFLTVQQKNSR